MKRKLITSLTVAIVALSTMIAAAAFAIDTVDEADATAEGEVALLQTDESTQESEVDEAEETDGDASRRGPRGRFGPGHGEHLADLAEVIGIDDETLTEALQDGQSLAEIAEANGVERQTLVDYFTERLEEHLADAVENGRLTQEEADQIAEEAPARIEEKIDGELQFRGRLGGGFGPIEEFTELLGVDANELMEALASGQTLAEVAEANGVDRQTLVDTMVSGIEDHLAEHVAEGRLSQEQADEIVAGLTERVESMIDGTFEGFGRGHRGPGFGPDAGDADDANEA